MSALPDDVNGTLPTMGSAFNANALREAFADLKSMLENMAAPQLENHIEGVPAGLDDASKFLQASCGAVGAFMDRVHVALAQHIQCASTWVEADAEKFQVEATCIDPLTAAAGTRLLFDGVGDGVNAVALELSEIGDEIKAYLEANFDGQPAVTASAGVSSAPGP